jgi:hypothetical protein
MLILIRKSELFTGDPDKRFSKKYKVQQGLWKEMWRRHQILNYSNQDLADYYEIKTGKKLSNQNVKRWINRTKVYIKIKPIIDEGVLSVNSYFFGDLELFVMKELTKNLKSSVKKELKVLP